MLTRVNPVLDHESEEFVSRTFGCAIRVHQALGPGFLEGLYHDATGIELGLDGLRYKREVAINVLYRGQKLRTQRLDLIVEDRIIVELKAVDRLERIHQAQLVSYLKATQIRVGLLMNFHSEGLKTTLRRFVL